MAIYTKRGDYGETSLYDENSSQRIRVSKSSRKIRVLGAIDELNSFLGICVSFSNDKKLNKILEEIQGNLLTIGSIIAGSNLKFPESKTKKLERYIDELEGTLPVLKNFVLPGGSKSASFLHFARSLSRRAERVVVSLNNTEKVNPSILMYLNRLSDALFMFARKINNDKGFKDRIWMKSKI